MNARQPWATDRDPVSKTKQTPLSEPPKGKNKDNLGGDRTREVTHPGLASGGDVGAVLICHAKVERRLGRPSFSWT